MIDLVKDIISKNDIKKLIEWLETYPRLTKGELTEKFEKQWSEYLGKKYSVYCNSGSSANLLALYSLIVSKKLDIGDKVVVPGISWNTDLSPVIQLGCKPILCDCNLDDLSIDLEHFENICKTESPKVLILVSALGLVPEMDKIVDLCEKYNVILMEDTCESLGSKHNGKLLGTFGELSTFSFYFGHHLSTIEGGMVCTDDYDLYNFLKMLRSHGWSRDVSDDLQRQLRSEYNISEFNSLFTAYVPGFNLRSTDLQAFIGLQQIKKVEKLVKSRNNIFSVYRKLLKSSLWKPVTRQNQFISSMMYPLIVENRDDVVRELSKHKIETRPLVAGNIGNHPAYFNNFEKVFLKNAQYLDKHGLQIPNHQDLTIDEITLISSIVNRVSFNKTH